MKLHETIKNTYRSTIRFLFDVEILTEDGKWSKVSSVNITEPTKFYRIHTDSKQLLCTENHILIDSNGDEVLGAQSIGRTIKTSDGNEQVVDVEETSIEECAYDVTLDDSTNHLYYANGMLSHNCVICDEFAFLQKNLADRLFTSMFPVISSSKNGKFFLVSTPNGTDNLYYDIWKQANAKDATKNLDEWKPFTMYYWQVPGHDTPEWKAAQIAAIGERRFAQEFNNEFLTTSDSRKMIPDDIIERYRIKLSEFKTKQILPHKQKILAETEDKMFAFDMWHEFDPKRAYLASGDVSEGVGGDASILYIWDVTDLSDIRLCAKFDSNTASLVEFAYVCSKILPLYGNPWLFCERNGVSAGMLDSLRITYKYPNIAVESKNGEPGVYSHVSVKGKACLWARDMMTTQGFGFTLYDKDLIDEFGTFVKKDTKGNYSVFTAAAGAHDDHIMAFIWGCYALQKMVIENYFVVCDTFTSTLGEIYPKILQPLEAYTDSMLKRIKADPLYKQFIEYKDEHKAMYEKMMSQIEKEDANDIFKYNQQDMYFGGNDGPSWNMPGSLTSHHVNPSNEMPSFFIN